MEQNQITAQMYTIREHCKTPADQAQSCRKLAAIGYRTVQVSGFPYDAKELRKMLDDAGLRCVVTHTAFQRLTDDLPGLVADLKTLGAAYTAVGMMPRDYRNLDRLGEFAEVMVRAGKALQAEGIYLGYHNHSFEFARFAGRLLMDRIFELIPRELMFAEIDTYWVQHGGADPIAWIRKFKGALPVVHWKDMGNIDDRQVMMEIGEGNLNWPGILAACREAGVKYYAVEQDNCNGRDPFESLAISYRNMRDL